MGPQFLILLPNVAPSALGHTIDHHDPMLVVSYEVV